MFSGLFRKWIVQNHTALGIFGYFVEIAEVHRKIALVAPKMRRTITPAHYSEIGHVVASKSFNPVFL